MQASRFPNGRVLPVDDNHRISTVVEVELADLFAQSAPQVRDLLAQRATGSALVEDVEYRILYGQGGELGFLVGGNVASLAKSGVLKPVSVRVKVDCATVGGVEEGLTSKHGEATMHQHMEHLEDFYGDML